MKKIFIKINCYSYFLNRSPGTNINRSHFEKSLIILHTGLIINPFFLILSFIFLSSPGNLKAQDSYSVQFSDTSSYDNTCGSVNPAQWSVKDDSCMLYTPFFRKETPGCMDIIYDFRVNQSGNGDYGDNVYVQYQLNGGEWITDTVLFASDYAAVHDLIGSINICYGTVIRFRVIMITNDNSEFWSIKNGDGTLTGSFVEYSSTPPLPIVLSSYKITCSDKGAIINWTTVSEINNNYFTVEKSTDLKSWNVLSIIPGANNSNTLKTYSFEDITLNGSKIQYYRLKQTDSDGKFKYFEILSGACNNNNSFQFSILGFNRNQMDISFNTLGTEPVTIEMLDMSGKIIHFEDRIPVQGTNLISIEPVGLNSGIYMISVLQNENRVSKKIMLR